MQISVNGTTLYYQQAGAGPAMVFVHGMCGFANVWDDQVARLAARFQCTTYDRRGHSRSPRTPAPESVELHADDLAGLITTLGLDPVIIVGSSGGARIALDLIRRRPDLVRGAVLSEPPVFPALAPHAAPQFTETVAPGVIAAAKDSDPRAAVDAFMGVVCPGLWGAIDEPRKEQYRANASGLFADLQSPPYQITEADVRRIDTPTLLIGGTTSHPAFAEVLGHLQRGLPDVRRVTLDCGHVTYAERLAEFAAAITAFADDLYRRGWRADP